MLHFIKHAIKVLVICFLSISLGLLIASLTTHHWRKTEGGVPGVMEIEYHHGLWMKCTKLTLTQAINNVSFTNVEDKCSRIESEEVSEEEDRRGLVSIILVGIATIGTFIVLILAIANIFMKTSKVSTTLEITMIISLFIFGASGTAGMASFTEFFGNQYFKHSLLPPNIHLPYSWSYSWLLGWIGTMILVIPSTLLLVNVTLRRKNSEN